MEPSDSLSPFSPRFVACPSRSQGQFFDFLGMLAADFDSTIFDHMDTIQWF
jgi:hypothetical protein